VSRTFPLSLRPLDVPANEPAAWFLPGGRAEAWL
jgi:hypothetical protein